MPCTTRNYHRFSVQCLGVIIALLTTFNSVHAGHCIPPDAQRESAYHYVLSLTEAMSYAKSALDRIPENMDSPSRNYDLFLAFKLGKADYLCAGSLVTPYVASSNEAIHSSAETAATVFARLAELQDDSAVQHKTFLNSIGKGNMEPGTILEERAELGALYDQTWKLLPIAATVGTYAVVEADPATGLMSRLALTAKQRDEILHKLRSTFGEQVTKGVKTGQISLVAAAAVLYEVIGNQSRKTRDIK